MPKIIKRSRFGRNDEILYKSEINGVFVSKPRYFAEVKLGRILYKSEKSYFVGNKLKIVIRNLQVNKECLFCKVNFLTRDRSEDGKTARRCCKCTSFKSNDYNILEVMEQYLDYISTLKKIEVIKKYKIHSYRILNRRMEKFKRIFSEEYFIERLKILGVKNEKITEILVSISS